MTQPIATLENCRYCLMCRHVDPLSHVTFDEALTPHGIALTIASQKRGLIDWDDATIELVFSELDNDNARAHCVTDQPFSDAVAAIKAELVEAGRMPPAVRKMQEQLETHGSAFGNETFATESVRSDVGLFVSDEAHTLRPGAVEAAEKLLGALGHNPAKVGGGRNSGLLATSLGLTEVARKHARALLDEVEAAGATRIVVLGPGDRFALTGVLSERLGMPLPEGIQVVELSELLAEALQNDALDLDTTDAPGPFAYVDPTFAVRAPDRHDHPRHLLQSVWGEPPLELFWRRERAHPVGSGAIRFVRPDIAAKLTDARLEDASTRGAEIVVSDDPATLWQLEMRAEAHGLQVQGLFELLAERLS